MKPKSIFQSKTFWVNALTALVGVLTVFMGSDLVKESPKLVAGLVTALGVVNVFLRMITDKPVTLSVTPLLADMFGDNYGDD